MSRAPCSPNAISVPRPTRRPRARRHDVVPHTPRVATADVGYAWSMRIRHELRYDAPPAEVYAMLCDPAFREAVCEALRVVRHDVTIDPHGAGGRRAIDMAQRTAGIPSFARKMVGRGRSASSSPRLALGAGCRPRGSQIPGKPGGFDGTIRPRRRDGAGPSSRSTARPRSGSRWSAARLEAPGREPAHGRAWSRAGRRRALAGRRPVLRLAPAGRHPTGGRRSVEAHVGVAVVRRAGRRSP